MWLSVRLPTHSHCIRTEATGLWLPGVRPRCLSSEDDFSTPGTNEGLMDDERLCSKSNGGMSLGSDVEVGMNAVGTIDEIMAGRGADTTYSLPLGR